MLNQQRCPECGLIFSRAEEATNKAAAARYKAKDRENILYVRKVPPDLKRWKLILYGTLLGLFGAHYFYTRRWWWGLIYLFGFTLLTVCTVFNAMLMATSWGVTLVNVLAFFVGIYGVMWIADMVRVCTGRFKIPVSLPMEDKK